MIEIHAGTCKYNINMFVRVERHSGFGDVHRGQSLMISRRGECAEPHQYASCEIHTMHCHACSSLHNSTLKQSS